MNQYTFPFCIVVMVFKYHGISGPNRIHVCETGSHEYTIRICFSSPASACFGLVLAPGQASRFAPGTIGSEGGVTLGVAVALGDAEGEGLGAMVGVLVGEGVGALPPPPWPGGFVGNGVGVSNAGGGGGGVFPPFPGCVGVDVGEGSGVFVGGACVGVAVGSAPPC
jgi:hypothetical protein